MPSLNGSTQFVHEDYFLEAVLDPKDSININGIEYYLVPKNTKVDTTKYYILEKEYPGSPKIGTKVMVHGTLVNFAAVVYSMEGIPKYEDLIKFTEFWKEITNG